MLIQRSDIVNHLEKQRKHGLVLELPVKANAVAALDRLAVHIVGRLDFLLFCETHFVVGPRAQRNGTDGHVGNEQFFAQDIKAIQILAS